MTAVGGSALECSVGGRIFQIAADGEAPRDLGGSTNTVEPNGDGATGRLLKRRKTAGVTLKLSIDDSAGDLEYLQDLADGQEFFDFSYTAASGITYGNGQTQIDGDIVRDDGSATAEINFKSIGKLEVQG